MPAQVRSNPKKGCDGMVRCLLVVLSLPTVSRGTLFELNYRAEQLGRAAQSAFELSKGRTIVGGRRVPNFLVGESEVNGGMYVGLEADEK